MTGGKSDISTKVKNKNSENVINGKFRYGSSKI